MRILQVSSAQQFGGAERHVVDLVQALATAGHEMYLAVRPASPLPALLQDTDTVTCYELPLRGALDLASAYQLAGIIRQTGIEVLHAHYARDYPLTALAVRYCRQYRPLPAFFITRHHYLPLKGNWAYRRLLTALDCAIAVSASVRDTLAHSFHWSTNHGPRLEIVPNWIDLTSFSLSDSNREEIRKGYGLAPGRPAIGLINQISVAKGQETLLKALALLKESHPQVQLILAGKEHDEAKPYTRYLQQQALELGIADRVIYAGYVEQIAELLMALDLVVIPSQNEAFSIVCLEAMAARRPVIASAVGGLAELITDKKTGLLFPVGDSSALAEQIACVLDSTALYQELTEQAYHFIEAHFARRQVIAKIENLYQEAILRRNGN
ncbi:MAG: glycosyltransferase family 4 protein [Acidobacteriota bacterium]